MGKNRPGVRADRNGPKISGRPFIFSEGSRIFRTIWSTGVNDFFLRTSFGAETAPASARRRRFGLLLLVALAGAGGGAGGSPGGRRSGFRGGSESTERRNLPHESPGAHVAWLFLRPHHFGRHRIRAACRAPDRRERIQLLHPHQSHVIRLAFLAPRPADRSRSCPSRTPGAKRGRIDRRRFSSISRNPPLVKSAIAKSHADGAAGAWE